MKSKRPVYALLAAVVLIWGLIAQRLWSAAQRPQPLDSQVSNSGRGHELKEADQHPPPLLLSYTDPFQADRRGESRPLLGKLPASSTLPPRQHSESALNFSPAPVAKSVPSVVWPEVKYLGSISNQRQGAKVALLSIDNLDFTLKPGDTIKGVKALKVSADSLTVMFSGQKKTLLKN